MCNLVKDHGSVVRQRFLSFISIVTLLFVWSILTTRPARAAEGTWQLGATQSVSATLTPPPTPEPGTGVGRNIIYGDQMISGRNYTLGSNDTLRGDLSVLGGNASLEEGSRVEGNVSILGGTADIYGTITGRLVVMGGAAYLHSSARIEGGESILGGSIRRDPGATELGPKSSFSNLPFSGNFPFDRRGWFGSLFDAIRNAFGRVMSILLIGLLAVAIVALFPTNVARISQTAQHDWLVSGSLGILTLVAVPILIAILAITICLIPAAILVAIVWALAMLFGWTVVACIAGERLAIGFNQRNWTVIGQTILGAIVLGLLGNIPFLGFFIGALATALGLGALLLTRVGTQSYPTQPAAVTPPQLPVPPAA